LYNLETIFIPAMDIYQFISSSTIKQIISTGGNIDEFVSKNTKCKLLEKYNKK
jgi:phosphopantetheine adenylyltransferase